MLSLRLKQERTAGIALGHQKIPPARSKHIETFLAGLLEQVHGVPPPCLIGGQFVAPLPVWGPFSRPAVLAKLVLELDASRREFASPFLVRQSRADTATAKAGWRKGSGRCEDAGADPASSSCNDRHKGVLWTEDLEFLD